MDGLVRDAEGSRGSAHAAAGSRQVASEFRACLVREAREQGGEAVGSGHARQHNQGGEASPAPIADPQRRAHRDELLEDLAVTHEDVHHQAAHLPADGDFFTLI